MKRIISFICIIALILTVLCACTEPSAPTLGNLLILGDSFSTFRGYIPDEYKTWYKPTIDNDGVNKVEHTWWHQVVTATRSNLLLNSSYSGSTVCNTGYDGEDYSEFSFASRITELIEGGFFEENDVDTLIVLGGLNDCWAQAPRGDFKYDDITEKDLYFFYPALSFIFKSVRECSPDTRIIFIIEEQLDDGMKSGIKEVAAHYGVETIEPTNIALHGSHPNGVGMKAIADQVILAISDNKE